MAKEYATQLREWRAQNPLRLWRKEKGLSRNDAATALNCAANTLWNWENGSITPNEENMTKLAAMMDVPTLRQTWAAWLAQKPQL